MTATGTFKDNQGNSYTVTFSGNSITEDKTLTLAASPVSISYSQGEHKYEGFRSVQAVVRIVTSEAVDFLYAESLRSISCTISKGSEKLFYGFVEPEAYDQPFLLSNDEIEITCIDAISTLKETYYTHQGSAELLAPMDYIKQICEKAGVIKIVTQCIFGYSGSSALYWPMDSAGYGIVTQAFGPEKVTDSADYPLTSVLSSICKFYGYNAICWGGVLYLIDPNAISKMTSWHNAKVYSYNAGSWSAEVSNTAINSELTINEAMFRGTDNRYSIEPAYQKIEITPDEQKLTLISDYLSEVEVERGGTSGEQTFDISGEGTYRYKATSLHISEMVFKHVNTNGETSNVTSAELKNTSPWYGAIPICGKFVPPLGIKIPASDFLLPSEVRDQDAKNYIWVRNMVVGNRTAAVEAFRISADSRRYMDGRPFRVSMQVMSKNQDNSNPSIPPVYQEGRVHTNASNWLTLKCGDKYYKWDTSVNNGYPVGTTWATGWTSSSYSPFVLRADGKDTTGASGLGISDYAWSKYVSEWIDAGEMGSLDLVFSLTPYTVGPTAYEDDWWISDICVEVWDDDKETYDSHFSYSRGTRTAGSRTLTTDAGLVAKIKDYQRVVNLRPGGYWPADYMGTSTGALAISASGLYLEHLKRYTYKNKCYRLVLDNQIDPWSKVTFLSDVYTVDAMEWDVANGVKTITIN